MKRTVLLASLLLPLLSGCAPAQKVVDTSKMVVGTYTQIGNGSGGFYDTYLCISFVDAKDADRSHSVDLQVNLNSGDRLKLTDDTPSAQVRYYDVAEGFLSARPAWASLNDFLMAGGLVEVFECASKYDPSVKNPAVSGKIYLPSCGYAYSLSTFSSAGEALEVSRAVIWTWKK